MKTNRFMANGDPEYRNEPNILNALSIALILASISSLLSFLMFWMPPKYFVFVAKHDASSPLLS